MTLDEHTALLKRRAFLAGEIDRLRAEIRDIDSTFAAERVKRWARTAERQAARDRRRAASNPVPFNERAERDMESESA